MAAELAIKITADGRAMVVAAQQATQALQGIEGQAGQTDTALRGIGKSSEGLNDSMRKLGQPGQTGGLRSYVGDLDKTTISAKQTAAALRGVPAQFTDIVVSLQGGQAPLTVFLQQGGQLKDMFGGAGNAAKALGGYIMGMINPLTIAAAAAAALAVAYYQGGKEAENYNKALILSGNIAGTTTARMADMARTLGEGKYTQSAAASAIAELAQSGAVAGERLQKFAAIAIDVERATGQAISKTADNFKDLEKAPLDATLKLNESLHYLTLGVYEQIKALTEQGRIMEAARLATDTYADAMGSRALQVTESVGNLEKSWKYLASQAGRAWDAMLGIGRDVTGSEQLAGLKKMLADREARGPLNSVPGMSESYEKGNKALRDQISLLEKIGGAQQKSAESSAAELKTTQAKIVWDKESEKFLTKKQQLTQEILKTEVEGRALLEKGAITQKEYAERLANVREKYKETAKVVKVTGESEVASIRAKVIETQRHIDTMKSQGLEAARQTEGEKLVIKIQQELEGSLKGVARANKEKSLSAALAWAAAQKEENAIELLLKAQQDFEKSRDKEISGQESSILKMEEKALAMEDQVRMYGMSQQAIESLGIARLQERADILAGFAGSEEQIALIQKEIDARQRLAVATDAKDGLDAGVKAAKDADAEWKKTATSIENTLTDSLMRAFEGGKSFAQAMRDTIVNMFKTMILRPVISAVMSPVSAAIGSTLGMSGAANAATGSSGSSGGGVMDMLGMAKNAMSFNTGWLTDFGPTFVGKLASTGAQVFSAGYETIGNSMMNVGNSLAEYADIISGAGDVLGYAGALYSLSKGNYGAAAGAAIGTYFGGPIGAFIGSKLGGLLDRGDKKATGGGIEGNFGSSGFSGNSFSTWQQDGGWFHSDRTGKETGTLDAATGKQFTGAYQAVQLAAASAAVSLGLSADAVTNYSERISLQLGSDAAANEKAVAKLFGDLGNNMAAAVAPGLAMFAKEGEAAGTTLARLAGSLTTANTWLDVLGQKLLDVSLAGGNTASQLADAFGGLENMATASKSFYETYYTEAERTARSQEDLTKALGQFGIALPASKDAFRGVATSLDLTTDAGRKAYAAMLLLAPEFTATTDAVQRLATEANKAIDDLFAKLADSIKSAIDGIASERAAVAQAVLQINDPGVMSQDAIRRGIAGTALVTPGNAGLSAAQAALGQADAQVAVQNAAVALSKAQAPSTAAFDGARAALDAAKAATAGAQASVDQYRAMGNGNFNYFIDQAYAGNDLRGSVPNPSGERNAQNTVFNLQAAQRNQQPAQAAYDVQLASYSGAAALNATQVAAAQAKLSAATAEQTAAVTAARAAQLAYVASLQDFSIDASKAVSKLGTLREETLKYYEAQKQLADLMTNSAAGLRGAAESLRQSQLTPQELLAKQAGDFAKNYSMTLATSGSTQAGYADQLTALLPGLANSISVSAKTQTDEIAARLALQVNGLEDRSATGAAYAAALSALQAAASSQTAAIEKQSTAALSQYIAQSDAAAAALAANAPQNYAADSLSMLGQIDAALAVLDASSKSAEKIIADAVAAGSEKTANGLRAVVAALTGQSVPAFASGGSFGGGLRIVGENGPELEATGPSRIFTASQTRSILSGGSNNDVLQELRAMRQDNAALRDDNAAMRQELQAIAGHTNKTARLLDRAMPEGDAFATRTAA